MKRRTFIKAAASVPLTFSISRSASIWLPSASVYPLDLGITFAGAWGLLPLSKSSSKLFRFFRPGDSAEQDIYRKNSKADGDAINAFVGANPNSCNVKTLYDQAASADATQSTAGSQPMFDWHFGFPVGWGVQNRFWSLTGPTLTGRSFAVYLIWTCDEWTFSGTTSYPVNRICWGNNTRGAYAGNDNSSDAGYWTLGWGATPGLYPIIGGNCCVNIASFNSRSDITRFTCNDVVLSSATLESTTADSVTQIMKSVSGLASPGSKLIALLAASSSHTDAQEEKVLDSIRRLVNTGHRSKIVLFEGDSITGGYQTATTFDQRKASWPYACMTAIGDPYAFVSNRAISSSFLVSAGGFDDMTARALKTVDPYVSPANFSKKILVVMGGTNDINGGATGSTAYSRLVSYCQARKAAGWSRIIVLNCIPRQTFDATKETYRLDFNSRIAGNGNTDWDASVDVAALNWQPGGSSDWSANYQDGIHPNASGVSLISNAVAPILKGFS